MAISNKMKGGLLAVAAVSALAVGAGSVASAQGGNSDTLVDKIATKFNLNKDDVQAVVDEDRSARQAERLADVSKDLQDAVDAGKITAEQKTLIENKMKENQAARETEMTALKEWATSNTIDLKYVMGGGRHGVDLDDAVADGDITAEQKTLIEQKQAELEKARDEKRDAMEQWAKDNNIDDAYLHMGMGNGGRGKHGGGPRE
jgi:hypothetical protein